MSERTPLPTPPKLGENVKDFSDKTKTLGELEEGKEIQGKDEFYHSVADDYIEKYAGDVAPEDKEQLSASVAAEVEKVFRSEQYGTKEQQVQALEKLILNLQGRTKQPEQTPAAPEVPATPERDPAQSTRPEGVPTTAEAEQAARDVEDNKHKYSMWQKAKMVIGGPALLTTTAWSAVLNRQEKQRNKFIRQPNETDQEYKKRTRRAMMFSAPVWIAAAYFAPKVANVTMDIFDGIGDTPKANANPAESTQPIEGDLDGNGVLDNRESAIRNGFGYNPQEDSYNEPGKLKPNNWGAPIDESLSARDAVMMPGLEGWKDSPEQMATVMGKMGVFPDFNLGNIEEMAERMKSDPAFYEKSYNDLQFKLNEPGTTFADGSVRAGEYGSFYETMANGDGLISYDDSINENDKTVVITYTDANGEKQTIELKRNCKLQPIDRYPEVAPQPVYYGTGGAAPVVEQPVYQPTYTEPTGEGGVPPAQPEVPGEPEVPVTPEVPEEPETPEEPEIPVEPPVDKDTSLTPDLDGLTPRGLEGVLTEHPGDYDPAVDAPVTDETGPTIEEDLGTDVGVDGADTTETNQNSNPVEEGVNPESTDGETPRNDPSFNPDNI